MDMGGRTPAAVRVETVAGGDVRFRLLPTKKERRRVDREMWARADFGGWADAGEVPADPPVARGDGR